MQKPPALDISSLEQAVDRLSKGWTRYQKNTSDLQIRDGLVQRFEFTYQISHNMLKRYLVMTSPFPDEYDSLPFQDLIRTGNEVGLLKSDWPQWRLFREMRGKTNHTYDEKVAIEVVRQIPEFLLEALYLSDQLRQRLDQ